MFDILKGSENVIALNEVQASQLKKEGTKIAKSQIGITFSRGNAKLRNTATGVFYQFNILSKITCPYKTTLCSKNCYAKRDERWPSVKDRRTLNTEATSKSWFVGAAVEQLNHELTRRCNKEKTLYIRIHESGDFYNVEYFSKWVKIADHFKGNTQIVFQAYTKSMPIIKEYLSVNNKALKDININFVWSIWADTKAEFTDQAQALNMPTFTALPSNEIQAAQGKYYICPGDCGTCKQCYTGKRQQIVIEYH